MLCPLLQIFLNIVLNHLNFLSFSENIGVAIPACFYEAYHHTKSY